MATTAGLPLAATEPERVITDLVRQIEPELGADRIQAVLVATVKRRPHRRELASVLEQEPDLLTSGQPRGLASLGRLVRALREAGAVNLVLPRCGRCQAQRPLKDKMGEVRICASCKVRLIALANRCVICNGVTYAGRDREGKPRCRRHPPEPDRDVFADLCACVHAVASALPLHVIAEAVRSVDESRGGQLRLLWAMEDIPALLTGRGAEGPHKTDDLIAALVERGAIGLVTPVCPFCQHPRTLDMVRDGLRCCRTCWRAVRKAPCFSCGKDTYPAARTFDGRALCQNCRNRDTFNQDLCSQCGTTDRIIVRGSEGAVCQRCYRLPTATCATCGRARPCYFADTTAPQCQPCRTKIRPPQPCHRCGRTRPVYRRDADGNKLCKPCGAPRPPCIQCGTPRRVHGRTSSGEPLCKPCWKATPAARRACAVCGSVETVFHHDLCPACAAHRRLTTVLTGDRTTMRPDLEGVRNALLRTTPPHTLLRSLQTDRAVHSLLLQLALEPGPVTHQTLDACRPAKAAKALRAVLVAGGCLPERDEHLAVLEQWLVHTYARIPNATEQKTLRAYVTWTQLRRLRRLSSRQHLTYGQMIAVKSEVRHIVRLLEWLPDCRTSLAQCTQDHLDTWLADGTPNRAVVRAFLQWTSRRGHTHALTAPVRGSDFTVNFAGQDQRWALVRRLVNDEELDLVDRAAGLLVLLFAQPPSRIIQLTTRHVTDHGDRVTLQLGTDPVDLPAPLADLVRQLVERRSGHAAATPLREAEWLFPGGYAGRPLAAAHLSHRLKAIDIRPRAGRHTALLDMASELPSSVVSRLLGFHVNTADKWQRNSPGHASAYAAELTRR